MGKLCLITGDIIEESKDMNAIVNAQNKYMANGSGICGAIYRASGIELLEYCQKTYSSDMETGEVRITPGFNLKMDIIHVLAPKFFEEKQPLDKLIETYENTLNEALKHNYKKVVMPSLGCGIHGYKHEQVAKPLMILLNTYCQKNDIDIYFVNIYPLYTDVYLNEYIKIKGINLYNDLLKLDVSEIIDYLKDNGLSNSNIKSKYKDFVKDKELVDLCLTEKIICLQYTIENFKVTKEQIQVLIDSMKGEN